MQEKLFVSVTLTHFSALWNFAFADPASECCRETTTAEIAVPD